MDNLLDYRGSCCGGIVDIEMNREMLRRDTPLRFLYSLRDNNIYIRAPFSHWPKILPNGGREPKSPPNYSSRTRQKLVKTRQLSTGIDHEYRSIS